MKIIQGQCKKQSLNVTNINQIRDLIMPIAELCKMPLGVHDGALAIAHCQVDHDNPKRFFVFADGQAIINPKILEKNGAFTHKEGCMSFMFRGQKNVKRYSEITVRYLNLDGKEITEIAKNLRACIFQHEIDHMNGIGIY